VSLSPADTAGGGHDIRWGGRMRKTDRNDPMQELKPTIWIGKQGCTDTIILEVIAQLKKRQVVKVKWLQNTEIKPEELAMRAGAQLVSVRGRTLVLAEQKKN
jgi:RNA-binding protein